MTTLTRREWVKSMALTALASGGALARQQGEKKPPQPLPISEYEPKSMLHVTESRIERSRFPVIDFHTHLSFTNTSGPVEKASPRAKREEILPIMDRKNVRTMVHLTGGYGAALEENLRYWQQPNPDRFVVFGTDAIPYGNETPQQVFGEQLYEIYYRFLETEDEYFDYAPAPIPPQGRWRIYGIGLPEGILKKLYHENAERLLRLK